MSRVFYFVVVVLLSGCVPPDKLDKLQQDFACKDNGGVFRYVSYRGDLSSFVRCNDNNYKKWVNIKLTPEFLKKNKHKLTSS